MTGKGWVAAVLLFLVAARARADEATTSTVPAQNPPIEGVQANGEQPRFDVLDYQIEGNTVLDDETLERAVYPHLGPDKTLDDVEKARASLEEAYRNAGYPTVMVAIPEQDVDANSVRLSVVEGEVETLHITGSRYHALGKIRDGVPALAEGRVPHMPKVQEQMNAMALEAADRNVTPIFSAGSTPGKMEVELRVKDELPLHGNVEMNSRNSEDTSYTRLSASLHYDNLWQKFHSLSLQYQVSPEASEEVEVWSGTYAMPTGWSNTQLALYGIGISSNTQLGVNVGGLSVFGAGAIYGARLLKPLAASSDAVTHSLSLGLDYKSFEQQVSNYLGGSPISYVAFMAGYDGSLRVDDSTTTLNIAAHFSFRGLGNDAKEFAAKRNNAAPNFFYLTTDLRHQQRLPLDFRLLARAGGQASMSALISNEQYAAGGPLSVRGYHQTQLLGDHGVNLSLELHSPGLLPMDWESVQNFRLLTFFDWANLWTVAPIAPTPASAHLASAGIGLRAQWFKHLLGELDWSYPLYRQATIDPGQQRIDFRMVYEF